MRFSGDGQDYYSVSIDRGKVTEVTPTFLEQEPKSRSMQLGRIL
jgi:hypothetical protein